VNAEYVWRMEAVLDLYAEPSDPQRPRVCFDEATKQLVAEVREPLPPAPGQPARYDYEYQRNGVANLFLFYSPDHPQGGWRHVAVTAQRTMPEFAAQMRALVDEHFPAAERIRVVLDNLNTHTPAALYAAFEPAEARRLVEKLEFIYTPKHASWLNQAEIELAVLRGQCLDRRIGDRALLEREVGAWEQERNGRGMVIRWLFQLTNARTKLKHLYPSPS
jgi:DDE superfamily endonuclease